jgi:hypothetical protein
VSNYDEYVDRVAADLIAPSVGDAPDSLRVDELMGRMLALISSVVEEHERQGAELRRQAAIRGARTRARRHGCLTTPQSRALASLPVAAGR